MFQLFSFVLVAFLGGCAVPTTQDINKSLSVISNNLNKNERIIRKWEDDKENTVKYINNEQIIQSSHQKKIDTIRTLIRVNVNSLEKLKEDANTYQLEAIENNKGKANILRSRLLLYELFVNSKIKENICNTPHIDTNEVVNACIDTKKMLETMRGKLYAAVHSDALPQAQELLSQYDDFKKTSSKICSQILVKVNDEITCTDAKKLLQAMRSDIYAEIKMGREAASQEAMSQYNKVRKKLSNDKIISKWDKECRLSLFEAYNIIIPK